METKGRAPVIIALIGLASAIGVAVISNWDKLSPDKPSGGPGSSLSQLPAEQVRDEVVPTSPVRPFASPFEGPLMGEETFTNPTTEWGTGNWSGEYWSRFDQRVVGGKYRWDLVFRRTAWAHQEAPYGSATDFYVATDVRVLEHSGLVGVGLQFGRSEQRFYMFLVSSNGMFALTKHLSLEGEQSTLIDWTPVQIDLSRNNRLGVSVEDLRIKLFINSAEVSERRDPAFTGGKVALQVSAWGNGVHAVVDFDNFEFRRIQR